MVKSTLVLMFSSSKALIVGLQPTFSNFSKNAKGGKIYLREQRGTKKFSSKLHIFDRSRPLHRKKYAKRENIVELICLG